MQIKCLLYRVFILSRDFSQRGGRHTCCTGTGGAARTALLSPEFRTKTCVCTVSTNTCTTVTVCTVSTNTTCTTVTAEGAIRSLDIRHASRALASVCCINKCLVAVPRLTHHPPVPQKLSFESPFMGTKGAVCTDCRHVAFSYRPSSRGKVHELRHNKCSLSPFVFSTNPLHTKTNLLYTLRLTSALTDNTLYFHYKDQHITTAYQNNRFIAGFKLNTRTHSVGK